MSNLLYPLKRAVEINREAGIKACLARGWVRSLADARLYARQAQAELFNKRLPSERSVLKGLSERDYRSLDGFLSAIATRATPANFINNGDRPARFGIWCSQYPEALKQTIAIADRLCLSATPSLKTMNTTGQPDPILHNEWHLDSATGRRWPIEYIERIDRWLWTDQRFADVRQVWEPNRHQYFAHLGKAYGLTGAERYAETCARHILDWVHSNPCCFGVNWYSPLEIGIRLIAWSIAFQFLRHSRRFRELAGPTFIRSLYQQTKFLREHLTAEWPGRNNHIIGEAAALVWIGAIFDEFSEAEEWRQTGLALVKKEVSRQTYKDGVNREQAVHYERFVLDFVLLLITLSRRGALQATPVLEEYAERTLEHLMLVSTPDRDLPALGDSDDGRAYAFGNCSAREAFHETMSMGSVLFQRPDFKYVTESFSEGAFWLLGPEGLHTYDSMIAKLPDKTSASFQHGGQYVIRHSWSGSSDYALIRCGDFGLGGEGFCAHAHCDLLSPILHLRGEPLLVDSGTYTYHGRWRDEFRLTAAHNSLIIDGRDQALPLNEFSWQQVPAATCLDWDDCRLTARLQVNGRATIQRELTLTGPGHWQLIDTIAGVEHHQLQWLFHLAEGLEPIMDVAHHKLVLTNKRNPDWMAVIIYPDVRVEIDNGWLSPAYGKKVPNKVIRASWQGILIPDGRRFRWNFNQAQGTQ